MRVLQINSVCGIGSTGRIATDIGKVLEAKGHDSYIAYGRGSSRETQNAIRIGRNLDNYIHVSKTRLLDRHGFGSKKATYEFLKKIEGLNPDIIHLHNIHGYFINIELLFEYLRVANKPVIWTLHDCWAFTGHCTNFDYIGCEKWKTECYRCPQKKEYPTSLLIDNSRNNFKSKKELFLSIKNMTIVTPSQWLANLSKESFLSKYPVKVINNGIDLNEFKPISSNFREKLNLHNKFIILAVARWDERKGLKYLLQLSEKLDDNYKIIVVGLTDEQKAQLPQDIIGITRTDNVRELVEIYSAADVLVNPTCEDNFPTTNLESLACGTPVITFNTGGSVESVDRTCGFVVEKEDINGLIKSILEVKSQGKYAYHASCINRATEFYDKEKMALEYIELYKER